MTITPTYPGSVASSPLQPLLTRAADPKRRFGFAPRRQELRQLVRTPAAPVELAYYRRQRRYLRLVRRGLRDRGIDLFGDRPFIHG